ncbi:MAG: GYF domain-containing protein [Prevotella sp.]
MEFFILKNNIQQGPFSLEGLRLQDISSDTLVWAEGMAQWTPAWKVEELKPLFYSKQSQTGTPTPPPPPASPGENLQDDTVNPDTMLQPSQQGSLQTENTAQDHKKWPWVLIILVALLIFMGVTNPSKSQHQIAVKENVTQGLANGLSSGDNDIFSQGIGAIGYMIAAPLINKMLDYMLQYHNYFLFSTTSITTQKGKVTVSYGFLGKVFTADNESIARSIRSTINNGNPEKNSPDQDGDTEQDSDAFVQNSLEGSIRFD